MTKKILLIFLIILIIIFSTNNVKALGIKEIFDGADEFIKSGRDNESGIDIIDLNQLNKTSDLIYNILFIIGICIMLIIGAILGIKFITGSVGEKVKVSEALIPYVIGCAVIFGAFGIWKLVIEILR